MRLEAILDLYANAPEVHQSRQFGHISKFIFDWQLNYRADLNPDNLCNKEAPKQQREVPTP